ncbi:Rrf2 family transcriptional regulator [Roseibium sp. MB-4]
MRRDSRLSRSLHLLIHMDRFPDPVTSDHLAKMVATNPVVIRRMMQGLKKAGLVSSGKGHGGGWVLAKPLADITLLDVHEALGASVIFNIGLADDNPRCLVEQAVRERLTTALEDAERGLLKEFAKVRLSDISCDFEDRRARLSDDEPQPPICTPERT